MQDCTRILALTVQAVIPHVTPEQSVSELISALFHSFVAEYCRPEAITVGLNAMREICSRSIDALNEEQLSYLATLRQFKDKGVSMAARSIVALYRDQAPEKLALKDRGRARSQKKKDTDAGESGESDANSEEEDERVDWMKIMQERMLTTDELEAFHQGGQRLVPPGCSVQSEYKIDASELMENVTKPKASYEDRVNSIKEGRPDRSVYQRKKNRSKPSGTTNAAKKKTKNFQMRIHKRGRRSEKKR
jgi:hypothetical protein